MKVVILAGGLGTRLAEETLIKPKPMIEIGGMPIIWHIMKHYAKYGFNDFIICGGYKVFEIKDYFSDFYKRFGNMYVNFSDNVIEYENSEKIDWKIRILDTGYDSTTSNRLAQAAYYINDEDFLLTYGDGVSDVNIMKLINSHINSEKLVTLTAVKPSGRFGALTLHGDKVTGFSEKIDNIDSWVNGGFFVINKKAIKFIEDKDVSWEMGALPRLAHAQELNAFKHEGFWASMDTLRDKEHLNQLWNSGNAAWKTW